MKNVIFWIKHSFSSAHFYKQNNWSQEENQKAFGRCFTDYGHGHNYSIEIGFDVRKTEINKADQSELKKITYDIINKLDHEHLNFTIPEFKTKVPTTENIATYILNKIQAKKTKYPVLKVKLFETNDLWVEVTP